MYVSQYFEGLIIWNVDILGTRRRIYDLTGVFLSMNWFLCLSLLYSRIL